MILSVCLVSLLPFLAYSWHSHGEHQPPNILSPDFDSGSPNSPPALHRSSYSHLNGEAKFANIWMMEKGKRTVNTAGSTATVNQATNQATSQAACFLWTPGSRVSFGYREDVSLSVEVFAPSGSIINWFKDNNEIARQGDSSSNAIEEAGSTTPTDSSSPSYLVIHSYVYLDCIQYGDTGIYRVDVQIPGSSQVLQLTITVQVTDLWNARGSTCGGGNRAMDVINYRPAIYQYANVTVVNINGRVVLPCRYQGLNSTHQWLRNNSPIMTQDTNHQIHPNGDLVIVQASGSAAAAVYTCRVRLEGNDRLFEDGDFVTNLVLTRENTARYNPC